VFTAAQDSGVSPAGPKSDSSQVTESQGVAYVLSPISNKELPMSRKTSCRLDISASRRIGCWVFNFPVVRTAGGCPSQMSGVSPASRFRGRNRIFHRSLRTNALRPFSETRCQSAPVSQNATIFPNERALSHAPSTLRFSNQLLPVGLRLTTAASLVIVLHA